MKVKCPFCGTLCFDNCKDEYKEMMQHIKSHVNENKELKKQVEELKDKNKQLIFELQDEAKFGLYIAEETKKNEEIIKRLKLKVGKYHGKKGYEYIDDVLQSILRGDKK